jgi:hypothetical protein
LWSNYGGFEEGSYIVLTSGTLPNGSYSASIKFRVPEATYGVYYVQFYQVSHTPLTLQFMLRPSLTLTPSSAEPGTVVSVKGSGFPGTDYGYVSMKNDVVYISVDINSSGTFSTSFTVPDLATGSHLVAATTLKLGGEQAQTLLQVLPRSPEVIVDEPDEPDEPVETPDNTPEIPDSGSEVNHPEPSLPVTNTAPPKPVIISPRDDSFGWSGTQTVTFNWGAVPEPEGVTYTLEIGQNFDFNPPLPELQMTRLTSTTFNMDIPQGTYYWRVRAVDSQGNEGNWAYAPYPFKVGEFPLAPVIIIGAVIIVIILFVGIIRAAKRRDNRYYY